jgi:hypothetical protein
MCFVAFNSRRQRPLLVLHTLKTLNGAIHESGGVGRERERVITENINGTELIISLRDISCLSPLPHRACVCVCVRLCCERGWSLSIFLSGRLASFANRYYIRMKHVARPSPIKALGAAPSQSASQWRVPPPPPFVPLRRPAPFFSSPLSSGYIQRKKKKKKDLWS